jgi:hypothetical protein
MLYSRPSTEGSATAARAVQHHCQKKKAKASVAFNTTTKGEGL